MNKLTQRINNYNHISSILFCMSITQIEILLADGKQMHKGIGGQSLLIEIDGIQVFVKKIPITNLELQDKHHMNTANIFKLPMCYQYGIGSAGFGAWREVSAHIMTTSWVVTNKCCNFPIMYHYRILKDANKKTISDEEQLSIDKDTAFWENNENIHSRLHDSILANHYIYLFMEFIPNHLYQWLNEQLVHDDKKALAAIKLVESQMKRTNEFMRSKNFLHMDAHFENILTDGENIYYSDFGLALSNRFNLSKEEIQFMYDNISYDEASSSINLLHTIITAFFGKEATVEDYYQNKLHPLPEKIDKVIKKHMPIALIMGQFYPAIQKDKSTIYPHKEIERLI
jgi:hypothetical protein